MTNVVPNPQIAEEAAAWAVLIDSGDIDAGQREELAQWLKCSPAHVEEFLLATSLLGGLSLADAERAISLNGLLSPGSSEVIQLFQSAAGHDEAKPRKRKAKPGPAIHMAQWKRPLLAASLAAIAVMGAALSTSLFDSTDPVPAGREDIEASGQGQQLATGIGEQRSIVLDDGSIVHLNARSSIRVVLGPQARNIELLSGEALFEVAHDENRPFRVMAGDTIAQAVGTTFNVERTGNDVQVTVVEGRVLVKGNEAVALAVPEQGPDMENDPPIILAAGQSARVDARLTIPTVTRVDLAAVTSWRDRELTFDGDSLRAIAERFNRYNKVQIEIADREAAQNAFSGVFDADDPESFIAFLELTGRFSVDRSDPSRVVIAKD